jgi:hypothetical protein
MQQHHDLALMVDLLQQVVEKYQQQQHLPQLQKMKKAALAVKVDHQQQFQRQQQGKTVRIVQMHFMTVTTRNHHNISDMSCYVMPDILKTVLILMPSTTASNAAAAGLNREGTTDALSDDTDQHP